MEGLLLLKVAWGGCAATGLTSSGKTLAHGGSPGHTVPFCACNRSLKKAALGLACFAVATCNPV